MSGCCSDDMCPVRTTLQGKHEFTLWMRREVWIGSHHRDLAALQTQWCTFLSGDPSSDLPEHHTNRHQRPARNIFSMKLTSSYTVLGLLHTSCITDSTNAYYNKHKHTTLCAKLCWFKSFIFYKYALNAFSIS